MLGHYFALKLWSCRGQGDTGFVQGERGEVARDKGVGKSDFYCGAQCCTAATLSDAGQVLSQMLERTLV